MADEVETQADDAANQQNAGNQGGQQEATQQEQQAQQQDGNVEQQAASPFAELPDEDTRNWLEKRGLNSVEALAKHAREQDKLVGNAIRVPGKDATPEEREAFLNKLGRPEKPDGYEFAVPKDLPENMPYDGERATAFGAKAHELGLTKAQAAGLHDWFVGQTVEDFNGLSQRQQESVGETAKAETEKLVKLWGPLDGQQMKTQLSYADKALRETGGDEALAEFQRVGLIGKEGNMILSAPIATMMAKIGAALYKEDDVLRGDPSRLDNPFEDGASHNVTAQMKLIRADRETALSMIAAAGKKPEDFGLKVT